MKLTALCLLLGACAVAERSYAVNATDAGAGIIGSWVLDCAGSDTAAPHVNHGYFWNPGDNTLGHFVLQGWVMPRTAHLGSRYWLIDGYGGAHAVAAGFISNGVTLSIYALASSSDGTSSTNVTGGTAITPGTWVHVTIGWDGSYLRAWLNGVLDGRSAWAGPRGSAPLSGGGGELFVCGSNHSNFDGRIAEIEMWEGSYPLSGDLSFYIERRFRAQAFDGVTATPANFLAVYTTPMDVIPDLSPVGYNGQHHPGTPYAAYGTEDRGFGYGLGLSGILPPASQGISPTWALDYNAPTAQ